MRRAVPLSDLASKRAAGVTYTYVVRCHSERDPAPAAEFPAACPISVHGSGTESDVRSQIDACLDMFARGSSASLSILVTRSVPAGAPEKSNRRLGAGGRDESAVRDA